MAAGSIVDYLSSRGKDSSYNARKKLAQQYGIADYQGTAAQNQKLLGSLQTGSGIPGQSPQVQGTPGKNPQVQGAPGKNPQVLGAPAAGKNVAAGMQGGGSGSSTTEKYLTDYTYSRFSPSDRTENYAGVLADLEANAPGDYTSRWQPDIDNIVDSIMNREKFETDDVFDSDLYKTMREQYIQNGQRAMRDTMGSAAAMTGGYGSTYSQAAGQQAYDQHLSQFNDAALGIYDRVYNQYLQEGQDLYNQLGMLNNQDSIEYGRYRDDVSDYYNDLAYYSGRYDQSYAGDMDEWQTDLSAQQWAEQYAYQKTQDALAQQNWQAQFDYQKEQDAYARQLQEQQLAAKGSGGGRSSGGSRGKSTSGSSGSGSKKETTDGYAPIAAGVVEKIYKNNWNNVQAYNYVMGLGEDGLIDQNQADKILKAAGINEKDALEKQNLGVSLMDDYMMHLKKETR